MTIRTMEVSLNEVIFQRLEQAARLGGISVSEFVLQLLIRWFGEVSIAELERQEIEAYKRLPVTAGEFDVWKSEQAWGEA